VPTSGIFLAADDNRSSYWGCQYRVSVDEGDRAQDANPALFDSFVRAESAALLRLAWGLTGERGAAEDLVQAALERVWKRWDRVRDRARAGAYTRRVVVSMFLTSRRRLWWGERVTAASPDVSVDDETDVVVTRRALMGALSTLPARQRAVVVLRFLDDRTVAQTAAALGCSTGTIKSHTARALLTLRSNPHLLDLGAPTLEGDKNG
jgi:RNA polymerase sigma-70 factor (sigma-E family)